MSGSHPGFPWRLVVALLSACGLLLLLPMPEQGGGVAAEVLGQSITRHELEEALREHLWRHNAVWSSLSAEERHQTRRRVLENLIDSRIVGASRGSSGGTVAVGAASKLESERLRRQFADPAEFPARLAAQHLTPKAMDAQIFVAHLDEAWIAGQSQRYIKPVTSEEVRAWYDEFSHTLLIPQACHAAHIFLSRHEKTKPDRGAEMQDIRRQLLAKKKTFAQLAREYSEDERSKLLGGDLGWFTQERMPADFMAALQKLPLGQVSEPVQTKLGWHLIILMDRHPPRLPALAEVQGEIAAFLTSRRRAEAVNRLIAELRRHLPQPVSYHAEVIDRAEPAP
ncbi:peptidylprolyl isomerase [Prosthecobacter fluviatilis]